MYITKVKVSKSRIEGKGVFAQGDIAKGEVVWKFTDNHDRAISTREFAQLPVSKKQELKKVGYLSPSTERWVFPPRGDPARFTNHSRGNNLSAVYNPEVSEEPYFIANRDIKRGEELTNNYLEFDKLSQKAKPTWM